MARLQLPDSLSSFHSSPLRFPTNSTWEYSLFSKYALVLSLCYTAANGISTHTCQVPLNLSVHVPIIYKGSAETPPLP